jgi:HTH-type transcriptional regulator/antitoxin HipB
MSREPDYFIWMTPTQLALAVITTRQAMGLTQVELGRRAKVGRKFVWELEQGKASLRVDKVLDVLRQLGLVPHLIAPDGWILGDPNG